MSETPGGEWFWSFLLCGFGFVSGFGFWDLDSCLLRMVVLPRYAQQVECVARVGNCEGPSDHRAQSLDLVLCNYHATIMQPLCNYHATLVLVGYQVRIAPGSPERGKRREGLFAVFRAIGVWGSSVWGVMSIADALRDTVQAACGTAWRRAL
jgi:hypothetical protein